MPKKAEVKSEKHSFVEGERQAMASLSPRDKEDALTALASHPVKSYLIAMLDELVRQGIYLTWEEQEGAKMMVKILGEKLQEGKKLIDMKDRQRRQLEKKKTVL